MFLPFPILAYLTFIPENNKRWVHFIVLLAVFAVGIGLAMGTEQLQSLLPYRSYDIEDFYADIFGMECSTILTAIYITFSKKA
jgi:VanZ family protein